MKPIVVYNEQDFGAEFTPKDGAHASVERMEDGKFSMEGQLRLTYWAGVAKEQIKHLHQTLTAGESHA